MSRATDLAYSELRRGILSGALPPGTLLREEAMAALAGVSRTPVREALRRLETEALVRRESSRRAVVADWSADDIDELFALRGLIEAHAAARAARRIDAAGLGELTAINRRLGDAVRAAPADIAGFIDANRAFHAGITRAAASPRLDGLLAGLIEQPVVARTARLYDRAQLERSHAEHDELLAAFAARDADWARATMTAHLRRAFHTFAESVAR